ncbi:MAG: hypothetical protein LBQ20_07540 [Rhodanobacter sp.]|nr:hypothetical protein [Rhodanobacter sp.]
MTSLSVRHLLIYFAARALPALASMALTFLCIQMLPSDQYALYSLTLLAAGVASGFVGGMSGQPMQRYSHQLDLASLRRALLQLPLGVAAVAVLIVSVYISVTAGLSISAVLAIASIPLLALVDARRNLFIARGRASAVLALDGWRSLLALFFGGGLLWLWSEQAVAPLAAQLMGIVICLMVVSSRAADGPHGTRKLDRAYLHYGIGIAGWMAGITALALVERSMLAAAMGLASSGQYAAQSDVINAVFAAGSSMLASAMMPSYLAQTTRFDAKELRRLCRVGMLGCLAIAFMCLMAGVILVLLPGIRVARTLTADIPTALTLIAAATVWSVAGFVQKPVELRGQTYRLFFGVICSLILFLIIALPLVEHFSAQGIALAKLTSGGAYILYYAWIERNSK